MGHATHKVTREDGAQSLTIFLPGEFPITVTSEHPHFSELEDRAEAGADSSELRELADLSVAAAQKFERLSERVSVANGRVYFDGDAIDNSLSQHIIRMLEAGSDFRPLVRFMENLASNPQEHSRKQLYSWLDARDFTITSGGWLVGYKGVAVEDGRYVSVFAGRAIVDGEAVNGQVPNEAGSIIEMPRSEVTFDPAVGCSTGLHVGTYDYAKSWARGALLKVVVNPRDVVSVPTDSNAQKMRVSRYTVIEVIDAPETLPVENDEYEDVCDCGDENVCECV
jgi:hypothetical protein